MKYTLKEKFRRNVVDAGRFFALDKAMVMFGIGQYDHEIEQAFKKFLSKEELANHDYLKVLRKDIKTCYIKYLTTPQEYFLFGFASNSSQDYRSSFLPDQVKVRTLFKKTGEKAFKEELIDKIAFYKLTSEYFRRRVFEFTDSTLYKDFEEFCLQTHSLFIKPLAASYGSGAMSVDVTDMDSCKQLYGKLSESRVNWIVEERIIQHPSMAQWNQSSVNTVRVPAFLSGSQFKIVKPFFRTGRKGSCVDNAGGGGYFCCIDEKTGEVISDGADEACNKYQQHPDSQLQFKGWRIPKWEELCRLVEKIHRTKMPSHRYIGWDFALTESGWVLVEGNWGQFITQYIDHQGIKNEFLELMK